MIKFISYIIVLKLIIETCESKKANGRWITEQGSILWEQDLCQMDGDIFDKCRSGWFRSTPKYWPFEDIRPLHYHIYDGGKYGDLYGIVNYFMQELGRRTNVGGTQMLQAPNNETNYPYIYFDLTSKFCGIQGRSGRKNRKDHIIYMADHCGTNAHIAHLLMHVIGFEHEINRHDRDEYVHIFYANLPDHARVHFEKNPKRPFSKLRYNHPFDSKSVMQFAVDEYQRDPMLPIIVPLTSSISPFDFQFQFYNFSDEDRSGLPMKSNYDFSELDIKKINEVYNYDD